MRTHRGVVRVPGYSTVLIVRFSVNRAVAREIARALELELGFRVEPVPRSLTQRSPSFDLRIHGELNRHTLRRARRTIEGYRPPSDSSAPASF